MTRHVLLIVMILLLGCTTKPKETKKVPNHSITQNNSEKSLKVVEDSLIVGDSITIPSFEIQVILTDKAKARMLNPKESIIVTGEFTGEPNDTSDEGLTDIGVLGLVSFKLEIDTPWIIKIDNIHIPRDLYNKLKNKDYDVLVQIWTGRRSSENNLLNGELIYGPISKIKGKTHKLNAKLLTE